MEAYGTTRRRGLAAAVVLGLGSVGANAQEPARLPVLPPADVEVYYGTTKVSPVVPPTIPTVELKIESKPEAETPKPRVEAPIYVPVVIPTGMWSQPAPAPAAMPSCVVPARFEFTLPRMQSPVLALLAAVMKRMLPAIASQPTTVYTSAGGAPNIIIIREAASEPKPLPITIPPAPPAQVVVVHEPAPVVEPKPAPEPAGTFKLSPEMMVTTGVGILCLLGVAVALVRSGRPIAVMSAPPAFPATPAGPPTNHDPAKDGPLLMGQYKVGMLPDTAERFDFGPSYQDEQRTKQMQEEAGKQAVVAHILSQNLVLLGEESAEPAADEFTVDIRN